MSRFDSSQQELGLADLFGVDNDAKRKQPRSHIQFRLVEPGEKPSPKIELITDAVREYYRRGGQGRIVSTTGQDVTASALKKFGHLKS